MDELLEVVKKVNKKRFCLVLPEGLVGCSEVGEGVARGMHVALQIIGEELEKVVANLDHAPAAVALVDSFILPHLIDGKLERYRLSE